MVFVFSFQIMHVTKIKYLTEYGLHKLHDSEMPILYPDRPVFQPRALCVGASLGNSVLSQLHLVTLVCLLLL